MAQLYHLNLEGDLLKVSFGEAASNDAIVKEVSESLKEMRFPGGPLLKINGPASLPVAMAIAHGVVHLYGAVAVFDPKLLKYVVCVSHTPVYAVGDLLD